MLVQEHRSLPDGQRARQADTHPFHVAGRVRLWLLERREPSSVCIQVTTSELQLHDTLRREGKQVTSCWLVQQRGSIDNDLVVCRISHVWRGLGSDLGKLVFDGDFCHGEDLIARKSVLIWSSERNDRNTKSIFLGQATDDGVMANAARLSLKQLRHRYPYMFDSDSEATLDFFKGWLPDFARACAAIDRLLGAEKRQFRWIHAGEELGGARYAFEMDGAPMEAYEDLRHQNLDERCGTGDATVDAIRDVVRDVMAESEEACMLCGNRGRLSGLFGAVMCLCDAHRRIEIAKDVWEISRLN